jgi:hypothetical protein
MIYEDKTFAPITSEEPQTPEEETPSEGTDEGTSVE